MKVKQLIIAGCIALCGTAFGSVTLNMTVNGADNFANASGVPTDGLYWGIMIDAGGNGFSGSYRPVALALSGLYTMTTSTDVASDDVMVISNFLTYTSDNPGTLFDVGPFDLANGVGTGDVFRIVWFAGDVIGTLADPTFILPADGALQDYTAPFAGLDPIRSAGQDYTGTSGVGTPTGFSFVPIPEPSAALLGALGALGLLRRRRI